MRAFSIPAALALLSALLLPAALPGPARAEDPLNPQIRPKLPNLPKLGGETLGKPSCFNLASDAPFPIYGSLMSNRYARPDGETAQHRFNFRLEPGQRQQVCTEGPFFEGRQLDLTLRALIPMYSCRTAVYGTINIHGRKKPDGSNEMWADCLIPKE